MALYSTAHSYESYKPLLPGKVMIHEEKKILDFISKFDKVLGNKINTEKSLDIFIHNEKIKKWH